jgi:hypothetical protein
MSRRDAFDEGSGQYRLRRATPQEFGLSPDQPEQPGAGEAEEKARFERGEPSFYTPPAEKEAFQRGHEAAVQGGHQQAAYEEALRQERIQRLEETPRVRRIRERQMKRQDELDARQAQRQQRQRQRQQAQQIRQPLSTARKLNALARKARGSRR